MDKKPSDTASGEKIQTSSVYGKNRNSLSLGKDITDLIENNPGDVNLADFFMTETIKNLQDAFSTATGIPSIITTPAGKPISASGEFGNSCRCIPCSTDISQAECINKINNMDADTELPIITTCDCNNLITGATGIFIREHHIASWIIGPVRYQNIDKQKLKECAVKNNINPDLFIDNYLKIQIVGEEQFKSICKTLHISAGMISEMTYTNIIQTHTKRERKKVEKNLRSSEQRYQEIFKNVTDWIYTHDLKGNFLENNLAFIEALGYSANYITKANIKDVIPKRFQSLFDDYLEEVIENGSSSGVMRVKAADKSELIIEYSNKLITDTDGDDYIQGQSRDITYSYKAEQALRRSEQKFRSILENIQEGYFEVDTTGNFTFFNKALCKMMDYSPAKLMGMNNQHYMDERNTKKVFHTFNKIYTSGESIDNFEFDLITKNRQTLNIQSSVGLIRSSKGRYIGFRGIALDITEKKQHEKELDDYRKNELNARAVTILGLAKLSEYRDSDAGAHLERMRAFSKIIAEELSKHEKFSHYITENYITDIYQSAILHDIGKVGIPDAVLLKPGKLDDDEFEIIQEHATLGGDAIKEIESKIEGESFLTIAKEIAYFHHEKWNGSGYPNGLKGTKIPLSARIVALADVYDALTSERVYKEAFSHSKAIEIITADSGHHFDPDIVAVFLKRNKDFAKISTRLKDDMF